MVKVDDVLVTSFPRTDDVISLTEQLGVSVTLSVPSFKLDVIYMDDFKGFSIRLPSYMYSEKLRGLCGKKKTSFIFSTSYKSDLLRTGMDTLTHT